MALLFCDGFDYYSSSEILHKWDSVGIIDTDNIAIENSDPAPRISGDGGSNSYLKLWGSPHVGKFVSPATDVIIVGFLFYCDYSSVSSSYGFVRFRVAGGYQASITYDSNGRIYARRGAHNGTIVAQSIDGVVTDETWEYIEVKIDLSDTGSCQVRVNEVNVIDDILGDYKYSTSLSGCDEVWFSGNTGIPSYIDDIVIIDTDTSDSHNQINNLLGDIRIDAYRPTDDGTYSQWTAQGAGDHYVEVDETSPDEDTTYVISDTVDDIDSFTFPDITTTGDASILAVVSSVFIKKSTPGAGKFQLLTRSTDDQDYFSSDIYTFSSYVYQSNIWTLNPDDTAAWEDADVNGAEFGIKHT